MTTVVNIRKEPYDVYIGRPGKGQDGYFGNPFKIGDKATFGDVEISIQRREECIMAYEQWFYFKLNDPEFKARILSLKNKRLGCFCKPLPCHGDVIAEYLNNMKFSPNRDKWSNVINRTDVQELREYITDKFNDLVFVEKSHQYYLNGMELTSVSKVVERFAPKFDAKAQAERCYLKYYNDASSKYYGKTPDQILKEWKTTNKKACDKGHEKHSYNETLFDFYTGKISEIELPAENDYMSWNSIRFWEDLPTCYIPLLSECRVYDSDLGYSGTFDLLCAWDRPNVPLNQSLILVDYKSNKDLFKNFNDQRMLSPFEDMRDSPGEGHYPLQLSLYQIPLENIGCKVIDRVLIYLNESKENYGKYKLNDHTKKLKTVL